jgi:hypothetical protein
MQEVREASHLQLVWVRPNRKESYRPAQYRQVC